MKLLAHIVSRIFDPLVVLVPFMLFAVLQSSLDTVAMTRFIMVAIGAIITPIFVLMVIALQHKWISNWDLSDRAERVPALSVLLVFLSVDFFLVWRFGDAFLVELFVVLLIWLVGFFLVTLRWKMSGHTGVYTLFSGLLGLWYGGWAWLLLIPIPLIAWARIKGKQHSLAQVLAGIVYSCCFVGTYSLAGVV